MAQHKRKPSQISKNSDGLSCKAKQSLNFATMTDDAFSNPALDLKADQLASVQEQKGGIPAKSLSKKAQELLGAIQALGCPFNDIKLQMHLGWSAERYEAANAELIALGNEEFQRAISMVLFSTGEVESSIQDAANMQISADTLQASDEKGCYPGASSQAIEQEDTPSSNSPDDFVHAAMNIGSPSYEENEKNCIIAILFIRILSYLSENVRQQAIEPFAEQGISQSLSVEYAEGKSIYEQAFFVPKSAWWSHLSSLPTGITAEVYKACHELETTHPSIEGALSSLTYLFQPPFWNLRDADLSELMKLTSSLDFNNSIESLDFFANTCDILERTYAQFSQEIGDRSIEEYEPIPSNASKLLITLLKPREHMRIYDQKCSLGSLLTEICKYLDEQGGNPATLHLAGEECNISRWQICKLNLFLLGINTDDIRRERATKDFYDTKIAMYDRILVNLLETSDRLANVQSMLPTLAKDGVMGILVPHTLLTRTASDSEFEKRLINSDLIEAIISLPRELDGCTRSQIAIILIKVNKSKEQENKILFIDAAYESSRQAFRTVLSENNTRKIEACLDSYTEINDYSRVVAAEEVIQNLYSLDVGRYVDASPEAQQIKRLAKQYGGYKIMPLSELIREIQFVHKDDDPDTRDNIVYISMNANPLLDNLDEDSRYTYKILLDSCRLIAKYLQLFLQSKLGSLMRSKLIERDIFLREESLMSLAIPVPEIATQIKMAEAAERLEVLKDGIQQLEKELIFSPPSASAVLDQVDGMLDVIGSLTDVDRLMSLIRQGECKRIEFKESFSLDIRKDVSEKYIELSSLKTIAAFLNSDGGFLLVGVNDSSAIVGLDREINRFHNGSRDKFLLHFKNNLKSRIGEEFYPYINQKLLVAGGLPVLLVECKKSASGCFLDGKDFYVRTNPSTDKLEGARLISYIKNNFSN